VNPGHGDGYPLSFPQLGLLFLHELRGSSTEYHIPEVFRLSGALDVSALRRALARLVERHESLRTTFVFGEDEPVQVIQDAPDVTLAVEDLPLGSQQARASALDAALAAEWDRSFDLDVGPLLRARLLRFGDLEHGLVLTTHHIASDGWSQGIIRRELAALYGAYRAREDDPLAPLSHRYVDFAAWQRQIVASDAVQPSIAYWTQSLAGLPDQLELSFRRQSKADEPARGQLATAVVLPELVSQLRQLSRSNVATLYMTLLSAFALLLAREGGVRDFAIATPIAGRQRAEFEPVVGFFVNTLAIRFALDANAKFADVLRWTRDSTLRAYEHQHVPFERVVQELAPRRALGRLPLAQVLLALHDARDDRPQLDGVDVAPVELTTVRTRFEIELHVYERNENLRIYWVYDETVIDPETATELLQCYLRLLADAADAPGAYKITAGWGESGR